MRAIDDYYRIDRRAKRAQALTSAIIQEIGPLLGDNKIDAHRAIEDLLWRLGVDPLTDAERERIGLRPRDNKGWTDEEIAIYEARIKLAMVQSISFPLSPSQTDMSA